MAHLREEEDVKPAADTPAKNSRNKREPAPATRFLPGQRRLFPDIDGEADQPSTPEAKPAATETTTAAGREPASPTTAKPQTSVLIDKIPESLRSLPDWCLWRDILPNREVAATPFQVNGLPASLSDPATWGTLDKALSRLDRGDYAGVGFFVHEGNGLVAIALSGCRNPRTGAVDDWAAELVREADSYAELVAGSNGVRIVVRATSPRQFGRTVAVSPGHFGTPTIGPARSITMSGRQLTAPAVACGPNKFSSVSGPGRFSPITGQRIEGPAEPQLRQEFVDRVVAQFFGPKPAAAPPDNREKSTSAATGNGQEPMAATATNGQADREQPPRPADPADAKAVATASAIRDFTTRVFEPTDIVEVRLLRAQVRSPAIVV